ncbi:excinuclease ABC subunit UvrA, partial [Rhizobium hidalgonense]|nr:excinuclease ABC subunit UvrA [Rhizobium hidalgonense]
LNQGAIRGWDRQRPYYFGFITKLAGHYDIDMDLPWNQLPSTQQALVLNGSGKEKIDFSYVDERGRKQNRIMVFEGVLPYLERRYRETESNLVRDDLSQYLSNSACDVCSGSRLNELSRNVKVASCTLPQVTQ